MNDVEVVATSRNRFDDEIPVALAVVALKAQEGHSGVVEQL